MSSDTTCRIERPNHDARMQAELKVFKHQSNDVTVPELDAKQKEEFMRKARALASKYRTNLPEEA